MCRPRSPGSGSRGHETAKEPILETRHAEFLFIKLISEASVSWALLCMTCDEQVNWVGPMGQDELAFQTRHVQQHTATR